MKTAVGRFVTISCSALLVSLLAGCAPEVGSERWCEQMRNKPAGDWSANEAVDYAQNCVLPDDEE